MSEQDRQHADATATPRLARPHALPLAGELEPAPEGPQRVTLILNPAKKRWVEAESAVRAAAAEAGWPEPRVMLTTVDAPGGPQAAQVLQDGADLVIAAGGDGTVRAVVHELQGSGTPLGIVPLGTANLFSRNLLLNPTKLEENVRRALLGRIATIDVGTATLHRAGGQEDHLFLVVAGIGHDAATVLGTRDVLKHHVGWLAYFESGSRHLLKRPTPMTITVPDSDGTNHHDDAPRENHVKAWSVLAGLCGRIPYGIEVFPKTVLDDGLFDMLEVTVPTPLHWGGIAAKGMLRLPTAVPGMRHWRAPVVTVRPAQPQPVQLDGDPYPDVEQLDLRVLPRVLRVKVGEPGPSWRARVRGTKVRLA